MKRVIREFMPPAAKQTTITPLMVNATAVRYNGKFYVDYLTDDTVGVPTDAYYVGEIANDGSVTDIIGDASQFPHSFSLQSNQIPAGENLSVITISPRQARLALQQSGLLDSIDALVATQPREVRIQWEYATEINRCDLLVCTVLTALGLTSEQIDALFNLASAF
jgi:hypothetical protein